MLIACAGLAACESDSSKTMTPEQRSAATPAQHDEYAKLGYRVEWRGFPAISPGKNIERMEVLGDVVAVQEGGATLTILESRSGERRWTDPVGNPLTRFVGINRDGKRIILSSESEAFFFDVETGALLTKQQFAQVVNTRPVQAAEILVYGTASGQVLGHLTLNGFRQWGSYTAGAIETDPVRVGDSGLVALVSREGDLVMLDGVSGSARGRARAFEGPDAPMAASDTAIFLASRDHSLYAFAAEGGRELWRVRTEAPLRNAPTFYNGRVYCDMGETGLTAYDAATGKEVWTNKSVHGTVIAVHDGRLLVWDGKTATTIEPIRGGTVDSVPLKDVSMIRPDQFVDGHLYLASGAGVVTKLTPRK
jgi:outer membrane protein assembly factor BamB